MRGCHAAKEAIVRFLKDREKGIIVLVPTTQKEENFTEFVANNLKKYARILFNGYNNDEEKKEVLLKFWLEEGMPQLTVVGVGQEYEPLLQIAKLCYFASGGFIFLAKKEVAGKTALITTAGRCHLCETQMVDRLSLEWCLCDECAKSCNHVFTAGNCEYCGRPESFMKKNNSVS